VKFFEELVCCVCVCVYVRGSCLGTFEKFRVGEEKIATKFFTSLWHNL